MLPVRSVSSRGVAAHAVPVELAAGFLDTPAVAVGSVGYAPSGEKLIFGVVSVGMAQAIVDEVACGVKGHAGDLILGCSGDVQELLVGAGVT